MKIKKIKQKLQATRIVQIFFVLTALIAVIFIAAGVKGVIDKQNLVRRGVETSAFVIKK